MDLHLTLQRLPQKPTSAGDYLVWRFDNDRPMVAHWSTERRQFVDCLRAIPAKAWAGPLPERTAVTL